MIKLEKLTQDDSGKLYVAEGDIPLFSSNAIPIGKMRTFVIQNPHRDLSKQMKEREETYPEFVPEKANAYLTSEFSGETQHIRINSGKEKMYSVYALQFYQIL